MIHNVRALREEIRRLRLTLADRAARHVTAVNNYRECQDKIESLENQLKLKDDAIDELRRGLEQYRIQSFRATALIRALIDYCFEVPSRRDQPVIIKVPQ